MIDGAVSLRFVVACVVIALVLGAFWFVGRALRGRGGGRGSTLALRETVFLPNGASLHLIRAGRRTFVIGRATGGIAVICELPADAPAASAGAPAPARERSDRCGFS